MSNFSALGISILASVIVLIGVGLSRVFWNWFFYDIWLKVSSRHSIDISGEWTAERILSEDQTKKEILNFKIKQYGWHLKGTIESSVSKGAENENKKFELDGIIQSDVVTFYFCNVNRRQRGLGSLMLEIRNNCKELEGVTAYFAPSLSAIASSEIKLIRKD